MAAGRRRTLARELEGKVQFVRRAYLLLPGEGQRPAYDEYVVSHRVRAAEMNPDLGFAIPRVGQKYPRSSVPAQLVAAAVQQSGFDLHKNLNHNDLQHLVQMVAVSLLYKGGTKLRDAQALS